MSSVAAMSCPPPAAASGGYPISRRSAHRLTPRVSPLDAPSGRSWRLAVALRT